MNNPPLTAAQRLLADPQYILTAEYWSDTLKEYAKKLPGPEYVFPDTGYENSKNCHIAPGSDRPLYDIASTIGPKLLEKLAKLEELANRAPQSENGSCLTLYRATKKTAEYDEYDEIMTWREELKDKTEIFVKGKTNYYSSDIHDKLKREEFGLIPIRGHVGDKAQASNYNGAFVRFVLKPGAHQLLFTPAYLALTRQGKPSAYIAECERLRQILARVTNGEKFVEAQQQHEGAKKGYIGLKPEVNGTRFSLQMGSDASKLLFQLFVDDIEEANRDAPAEVRARGQGHKADRRAARKAANGKG